jgi:hypothetical protein
MPEQPAYETPPARPGIDVDEPLIAPPLPDLEDEEVIEEELWVDESGEDYSGWYCVRTDPWGCPAVGCEFVANFLTAAHLVIVWPERDDPSLLRHAAAARDVGRNPRPDVYEPAFGPACSYYQWEAAGHPVHAVRADIGQDVYKKK